MKKIILALSAAVLLTVSCSKKHQEVQPAPASTSQGTSNGTNFSLTPPAAPIQYAAGSKSYVDEVSDAIAASGIKANQISENKVLLSKGNEQFLLESENGELYVSNPLSTNGRISKTPLKSGAAKNGGFYGIMIYVTQSNYKEIVAWFSDEDNSPFEVLFGEELYNYLTKADTPDPGYEFSPKLNVKKLPKGAFEVNGTLSARSKGALDFPDRGFKVSVTGESPGMFGFHMDKQAYVEGEDFSIMATTELTDKDYVMANGTLYPGSKDASKNTSFVFMFGLGLGANKPPMGGIMIGLAAEKKSAVIFIGVFKGLKVK